jgi:hypothetical protein
LRRAIRNGIRSATIWFLIWSVVITFRLMEPPGSRIPVNRAVAVVVGAGLFGFLLGVWLELFGRTLNLHSETLVISQSQFRRLRQFPRDGLHIRRSDQCGRVERVEVIADSADEPLVFWLRPDDALRLATWVSSTKKKLHVS